MFVALYQGHSHDYLQTLASTILYASDLRTRPKTP